MDLSAIALQLRQVEVAFSKSRINVYSDKRKEVHYNELYNLFLEIDNADKDQFSDNDINIHYQLLNYILNGLEYLDSSTLNNIPYELVSCLEYVLEEWIEDKNFIIVTSLSNKHLEYLFDTYFDAETFLTNNDYIKSKYDLSITNRLVRITLPKSLSRDYLASVVLYHELGHFVDSELAVSKKLINTRYGFLGLRTHQKEFYHTMEYFADIFAAQYVSNSSNYFLERITPKSLDRDFLTHPSLTKRLAAVNCFLNGDTNDELIEFNNILSSNNNLMLKKRCEEIDPSISDFENLIPQQLSSVDELHGIFKLAWEIWLKSDENFLKDFSSQEKYKVINNLVEKSISNFTILSKWNG